MLDHFVDGSKRKRNRLTIALEDEPGKMFGILKVREIRMEMATKEIICLLIELQSYQEMGLEMR
jgi:hypothetical protein